MKWKHFQCLICNEVWPTRQRNAKHECLRCTRDKNNPKKFSKANNIHPGSVPECLQNLTQVEEMLIARVSPIMYVYRKHGGQRGYKGHVLIARHLIIMEVGRFFVRTNLTNRAKNSQRTFINVPSAIQWLTSKGFLSVYLRNKGF